MGSEFVIEEMPEGRTVVVTGRWSEAAEAALHRPDVDGLWLNYARGFTEPDLSFVSEWPIRRLSLIDRSLDDLAPLGRLAETLEKLSVQAGTDTQLDLSTLPNLRSIFAPWESIRDTIGEPTYLTHVGVMDFTEIDLEPFTAQPSLQTIRLKGAARLESLAGLGGIPTLTTLRIAVAPRLSDLGDVGSASATLADADFEACGAIEELSALERLRELRFLGIGDAGPVESFSPLASLAKLERLYAWGTTRVLDGDLSPLLKLQGLTEIRMRDRSDYRPRLDEIKSQLATS